MTRHPTVRILLTVTETGMLAYWVFAALVALGALSVPPEAMYPDHRNAFVVAWNWSFLPIDVMFALMGLVSRFGNLPAHRATVLAVASLTLMFCAGLMALSFWVIIGFYDVTWWALNLWLVGLSSAAFAIGHWRTLRQDMV